MAPSTTMARLRSLLAAFALALSLAGLLDVTAAGAAEVTFVLTIATSNTVQTNAHVQGKARDGRRVLWTG